MVSGLPIVTPASFVLSRTGKLYYSNSGLRGGGAEAALAVELINVAQTPRQDLLAKLWYGLDAKDLGNGEYAGLQVTLDGFDIIAHNYQAAPDINVGAGALLPSPGPWEFIIPRRSELVITGLCSDTDNQRYTVLIAYPV